MSTKAVRIKWVEDHQARERSFPRRRRALFKKLEELAAKCEALVKKHHDPFVRTSSVGGIAVTWNARPKYQGIEKLHLLSGEDMRLSVKIDKMKPEIRQMERKELGKFSKEELALLRELDKFSIKALVLIQDRIEESLSTFEALLEEVRHDKKKRGQHEQTVGKIRGDQLPQTMASHITNEAGQPIVSDEERALPDPVNQRDGLDHHDLAHLKFSLGRY